MDNQRSKFGEDKNWIGIIIVAALFAVGIGLYFWLGDLGLGEYGPLAYLIPLIAVTAGLFAWLSRSR
jgi:hypothetical protein